MEGSYDDVLKILHVSYSSLVRYLLFRKIYKIYKAKHLGVELRFKFTLTEGIGLTVKQRHDGVYISSLVKDLSSGKSSHSGVVRKFLGTYTSGD